jgi:hypothetical protein
MHLLMLAEHIHELVSVVRSKKGEERVTVILPSEVASGSSDSQQQRDVSSPTSRAVDHMEVRLCLTRDQVSLCTA